MTRDLKTPLAPTFPQDTMGGPGKRKKKKKSCRKGRGGKSCKAFRKHVQKHGYGGGY
jgi:hypothetical protein